MSYSNTSMQQNLLNVITLGSYVWNFIKNDNNKRLVSLIIFSKGSPLVSIYNMWPRVLSLIKLSGIQLTDNVNLFENREDWSQLDIHHVE